MGPQARKQGLEAHSSQYLLLPTCYLVLTAAAVGLPPPLLCECVGQQSCSPRSGGMRLSPSQGLLPCSLASGSVVNKDTLL
jgi:hypothetical protein